MTDQYEYMLLNEPSEDTLNSFGRHGWHVVSTAVNRSGTVVFVLERKVRS